MKLIVSIQQQALQALLGGFENKLRERLIVALNAFGYSLQTRVKEKLSDDVLHVRSGNLRTSINVLGGGAGTTSSGGIGVSVGTNIVYAAAHEYGFHGTVTVKEYMRRSRGQVKADMLAHGKKWGRLSGQRKNYSPGDLITVRAHTAMMNLPERSFLRSSLKEMQQQAIDAIQRAAKEALNP